MEQDTHTPAETHQTLYRAISDMLQDGKSYGYIADKLLPDIVPSSAKGIIWRFHKKNEMPTNNEIRIMLGLPKLITVPADMVRKTPPRVGKQKYTYSYIKVRADDPESAAATIINSQATDEYITRLAHLLTGIERKV